MDERKTHTQNVGEKNKKSGWNYDFDYYISNLIFMQFLLLMFFLKMARTSAAAARTIKMQRIIFVYLTWNFSTKSHQKNKNKTTASEAQRKMSSHFDINFHWIFDKMQ